MNFKRTRPKNTHRAGCIMCKPWKRVGCQSVDPKAQHLRIAEKARQEKKEEGL